MGRGKIKDFLRGGTQGEGIIWKGGDKYPLGPMLDYCVEYYVYCIQSQPVLTQCWISIPLENERKSKVKGFLMFSEGREMKHWTEMG